MKSKHLYQFSLCIYSLIMNLAVLPCSDGDVMFHVSYSKACCLLHAGQSVCFVTWSTLCCTQYRSHPGRPQVLHCGVHSARANTIWHLTFVAFGLYLAETFFSCSNLVSRRLRGRSVSSAWKQGYNPRILKLSSIWLQPGQSLFYLVYVNLSWL